MANLANLIACTARVKLSSLEFPVFLVEFHPRDQHLHAFSSLNRLYHARTQHERKKLTADLQLQRAVSESRIDPLTKIANRRALEEQLSIVWKCAFYSQTCFSFLMLNIDFFKKINDKYGHSQGDQVLVRVTDTLSENVSRPEDMEARFGGEEFSVVLPHTGTVGAQRVADKILVAVRGLNTPNIDSDIADYLIVSIGGYTLKPSQLDIDLSTQIHFSDLALYRAKAQGRNCAVHHGAFQSRNEINEDSSSAEIMSQNRKGNPTDQQHRG